MATAYDPNQELNPNKVLIFATVLTLVGFTIVVLVAGDMMPNLAG